MSKEKINQILKNQSKIMNILENIAHPNNLRTHCNNCKLIIYFNSKDIKRVVAWSVGDKFKNCNCVVTEELKCNGFVCPNCGQNVLIDKDYHAMSAFIRDSVIGLKYRKCDK